MTSDPSQSNFNFVFLENLMSLSFECRRSEAKVKWLGKKIETEQDEYKLEKYKIDLDETR